MKLNQDFKVRKDINGYIAFFEFSGSQEFNNEKVIFILNLLKEDISQDQLISQFKQRYPDEDAADCVNECISSLEESGLLSLK